MRGENGKLTPAWQLNFKFITLDLIKKHTELTKEFFNGKNVYPRLSESIIIYILALELLNKELRTRLMSTTILNQKK